MCNDTPFYLNINDYVKQCNAIIVCIFSFFPMNLYIFDVFSHPIFISEPFLLRSSCRFSLMLQRWDLFDSDRQNPLFIFCLLCELLQVDSTIFYDFFFSMLPSCFDFFSKEMNNNTFYEKLFFLCQLILCDSLLNLCYSEVTLKQANTLHLAVVGGDARNNF